MKKLYYSFSDLELGLHDIIQQMTQSSFKPDVIVGPGRGAYVPGVMLSHYYQCQFEGFKWQTRDGKNKDSAQLNNILSKYCRKNILIVDDVNDTGETLSGIKSVIDEFRSVQPECGIKVSYATLFNKESSDFKDVNYTSTSLTVDYDPWIVFPYEEWWK
jgi:uncharacterized protein